MVGHAAPDVHPQRCENPAGHPAVERTVQRRLELASGANSTKPPPALRKAAPETGKRLLACLGSARVLQVVQPLGDRALAVGGLVLVDDALARRLVELARSEERRVGKGGRSGW